MRFWTEERRGYLLARLAGRESARDMREFLVAVHDACRRHGCPRILMSIERSRAVFKPEEYGLAGSAPGYAAELVTPACHIALVGDTPELNAAHEYIEVVARQQDVNVRAFRDEAAAARWLLGAPRPARRYRFRRVVLAGLACQGHCKRCAALAALQRRSCPSTRPMTSARMRFV